MKESKKALKNATISLIISISSLTFVVIANVLKLKGII